MVPETDDIYEFIRTIDAGELNRKAIESLIKAGAFDDINSNRAQCMAVCDDAVKTAQKMNKASNTDQISLFDIDEEMLDEVRVAHELPKVSDFSLSQKLALEKEVLGVYISGHPLDEYRTLIEENITARTSELISLGSDDESFSHGQLQGRHLDGDRVLMAGMLENVKKMLTKDSKEMARISLEDLDGVIGGIVFSRTFEKCRHILKDDEIVGVLARLSMKEEGQTELIVEDVAPVGELPRLKSEVRGSYMRRRYQSQGQQGEGRRTASSPQVRSDSSDRNYLKLRLTEEAVSAHGDLSGAMYHILDVLSMYPGETEVLVYLPDGRMVRADSEHRACCCEELRTRLERILGAENVKG